MRARLLTVGVAVAAAVASVLADAGPAWAGDPNGQYGWTNAEASGGQLTVQAGHTYWTPPSGSSWATSTKSDPPPGKPNPNQPYGCRYQADPQAQQELGAGGPTPGQWVIPTCAGPGVIDPMPPFWVANPQAAAQTVQVDPVVVGQQAAEQIGFASPSIEMAPPPGSPQLVGVATWLWIDPGAWRTLTASATAGPVTATATATPSKVVWDMGDGDAVTCDGPSTAYSAADPDATTDCSYAWPQAGSYTVTATVYWTVTVTESQAINTPTGGAARRKGTT